MAHVQHSKTNSERPTSNIQRRNKDKTIRRICFVTGTRAEFGLMHSTLSAIREHPRLKLQIIATGMHLSSKHGRTVRSIRDQGWTLDATVPWNASDESQNAAATGRAMAGIAAKLDALQSDVVLVVGDRVEAFAAAAAGHISGRIVAHLHGGDRALGQVDDALRHAITKLAHVHFPATVASRRRIIKLGEDPWRVHQVGSPGIDGIAIQAAPLRIQGRFALLVLHPTGTDEAIEQRRAAMMMRAVRRIGFDQVVVVYPNNDPGSAGIIRCWESLDQRVTVFRDVPRPRFLGLMRDAAVLVGNSSSGIIEAASFGTPVVDIGDRQKGRERSANVVHVEFNERELSQVLSRIWDRGKPLRFAGKNVYGGIGAGGRIANHLAGMAINDRLRSKLIAY